MSSFIGSMGGSGISSLKMEPLRPQAAMRNPMNPSKKTDQNVAGNNAIKQRPLPRGQELPAKASFSGRPSAF